MSTVASGNAMPDAAALSEAASERRQRPEVVDDVAALQRLLDDVLPKLVRYRIANATPDETKVVEYSRPERLEELLLGTAGSATGSAMPDQAGTHDEVLDGIQVALDFSVRTGHPRFFDKLYAGSDSIGQVAELVTAVLNTNSHTFAVSPVFNVLERAVVKGMAERIGFKSETCDGLLGPGGTFNNITALMLARHACFPHVRLSGWQPNDKPVCFTSVQAHYSIKRGAMLAGIGMDACVPVAASMEGSMSATALDEEITRSRANGLTPFFVSCTAGTTVLGGFDEFAAIRAVIDKHNATMQAPNKIWMHVDGAWGGSLAMSDRPELRERLSGVELADSMLWNFHKGLGLPIFASALLTNNRPGALEASNQSCAEYLFHATPGSEYDLGDKSLQCGRRADSFKIWLSWRYHGTSGFATRVERAYDNAQYLAKQIKKIGVDGGFSLVAEPKFCNVCWWYVPKELRARVAAEGPACAYSVLDKVTPAMYEAMQRAGSMLINFNPLSDHGLPRFFRIVTNNSIVNTEDMDFVLAEMQRLGETLAVPEVAAFAAT